jgi:hypothetical protein
VKHFCAAGLLLFCLPALLLAQLRPTPEEAKKVVDYYFNGKGKGVILMDYKLCQTIPRKGAGKYECQQAITGWTIRQGQRVFLWMNFLVPATSEVKVLLQLERRNVVRKTIDLSLPGSLRHRTWTKIPTHQAGKWKVNILQETNTADLAIGQFEFSITPKNKGGEQKRRALDKKSEKSKNEPLPHVAKKQPASQKHDAARRSETTGQPSPTSLRRPDKPSAKRALREIQTGEVVGSPPLPRRTLQTTQDEIASLTVQRQMPAPRTQHSKQLGLSADNRTKHISIIYPTAKHATAVEMEHKLEKLGTYDVGLRNTDRAVPGNSNKAIGDIWYLDARHRDAVDEVRKALSSDGMLWPRRWQVVRTTDWMWYKSHDRFFDMVIMLFDAQSNESNNITDSAESPN